jgi:hypothetical protein
MCPEMASGTKYGSRGCGGGQTNAAPKAPWLRERRSSNPACVYQKCRTSGSFMFSATSHSLRSMMPAFVAVLLSLRSLIRSRAALHLEVLALRHQLQVLNRSRRRACV